MSEEPLFIPRRLAIELLAEAQRAPEGEVHGWIGALDDRPVAVWPAAPEAQQRLAQAGQTIWAVYHAHTQGPAPAATRTLVISLDTKGVLQLRCWECLGSVCVERRLVIGTDDPG